MASLLLVALAGACVPAEPNRSGGVVTLVPSFADDVYALGGGQRLVGVSAFTDDPRAAKLPRIADANSVDVEEIVALRPDSVIGIPAQARQVEPLRHAGLRVVLLNDDGYEQIFVDLRAIGALAGRQTAATETIARLRRETALLEARASRFAWHPRVFVVLQSAPVWTAGSPSYMSRLIELAGGRNAAADLREAYSQYSAEDLVANQPDVLVADRAARLETMLDREPWRSLRAVRLRRVYDFDSDLLNRPGPHYNDAIRWLQDRLSPIAMRSPR